MIPWTMIGLGGLLLFAASTWAEDFDWEPRDVAAAESYQVQERERAQRYRERIAGGVAAQGASRAQAREQSQVESSRIVRTIRDRMLRSVEELDLAELEHWMREAAAWWQAQVRRTERDRGSQAQPESHKNGREDPAQAWWAEERERLRRTR